MKRWNLCVSVLVVTVSLVLVVPASGFGPPGGGMMGQAMPEDMLSGAEFKPVVGLWAEYRIVTGDQEPMTMRISIVGEEDGAYWYETKMVAEQGDFITKMLVSGDPEDEGSSKRLIFKRGDDPAMEMPVGDGGGPGAMMGGPAAMMGGHGGMPGGEMDVEDEGEPGRPDVKPVDLGIESITVPAGTFDAHHTRIESDGGSFDMWQSDVAGPYGVVKSTSPEFEMILVGYGDDATSAITEEPQKFEMPSFNMKNFGG